MNPVNTFIAKTIKGFLIIFGLATCLSLIIAYKVDTANKLVFRGQVDYTPQSVPIRRHWGMMVFGIGLLLAAACAPQPVAPPTPAPPNTIQDILWQWVSVAERPSGATTTVSNPGNYTLTFRADGTLEGKADCNAIAGTYSQEDGFTIELEPSTLAFCGEASLDQQFLQLLDEVVAGGPDGAGGLALENAGGEKRMLFKNGGTAAK